MGAELIVKPEPAIGTIEEDGVIAGDIGFAHEFGGGGPGTVGAASDPDGDIGLAFGGTAKPSREKIAVFQFDDGGSVGGRKGACV